MKEYNDLELLGALVLGALRHGNGTAHLAPLLDRARSIRSDALDHAQYKLWEELGCPLFSVTYEN